MGRGTAGSPRATQCLIATITNIVAHVLLLLVSFYYIAARDDIEIAFYEKLVKDEAKEKVKLSLAQWARRVEGIESRVKTGALIGLIFSITHILVLVGALFVVLKKKDAKLVRSYANGAGILFFVILFILTLVHVFIWHGGYLEFMYIMYWICIFATAFNVTAMERYRRELLLRGNAGGRNRGWATPRADVEQDLSAANVNDQAAPASNEAAAPEGDQNAGST